MSTTPEAMTVIYFISTLMSSNKHKKQGEMWSFTKQMKKESSSVSVVNKSQYHDTHSEDTIGVRP